MKIMVFSPHADDETLGAGGYLLKRIAAGDEVYWVNFTNAFVEYGYTKEEEEKWKRIVDRVKNAYGFADSYEVGLAPAGLDTYAKGDLISRISKIINEIRPEIMILPYPHDIHSDHGVVFDIVYSCSKKFRYPFVKKIMCMEVISESDYALSENGFVPNYYVDIDDFIDKKIDILKLYEDEIKEAPFPRNESAIRGLAAFRGAGCYAKNAEAFRIIREYE